MFHSTVDDAVRFPLEDRGKSHTLLPILAEDADRDAELTLVKALRPRSSRDEVERVQKSAGSKRAGSKVMVTLVESEALEVLVVTDLLRARVLDSFRLAVASKVDR